MEVVSLGLTTKKESEDQQAPGQFLRHYAPDIESYLYSEKGAEEEDGE